MGTITSNGYYSLNNLLSGGSGNAAIGSGNFSTASLLSQASGTGTSGSPGTDAYLLNLSPQAQAALTGSSSSFTLTGTQKTAIADILDKYKDAPFTQDTFDQIMNDLQEAGLSPATLSAQDRAKSFNATAILISALSGHYVDTGQDNSDTAEQAKQNNYLQSIVSQWKNLSSTAADTRSAGSDATGVSA